MLLYITILLFYFTDMCQCQCQSNGSKNCIPTERTYNSKSCAVNEQDKSPKTWVEMKNNCSSNGRLVWLRDDFNETNLYTVMHYNDKNDKPVQIVTGLMMSLNGDNRIFWSNPIQNISYTCGLSNTKECLQSPTNEDTCLAVGCCWSNSSCQYPEYQRVAEYAGMAKLDTRAVNQTTRRCVGLQKRNTSWTLVPFNCSEPIQLKTSFVCEYKCGSEWPSVDIQNVTSLGSSGTTQTLTSSISVGPTSDSGTTNQASPETSFESGASNPSTLPLTRISSEPGQSCATSIFKLEIILPTLLAQALQKSRRI